MIKLTDYIKDCLKDNEFKKIWEEENPNLPQSLFEEFKQSGLNNLTLKEALKLLKEMDDSKLNKIIDNKGIHPEVDNLGNTEIIFYENKDKCPIKDFLNSIDNKKLKVKTLSNIVELSIRGSESKPPLSKYVDEGIFELRTKHGSNIDRIFYFFIFGNKIIMTNGYIKKSQKLDSKEFELAKKYRDSYMKKNLKK